MKQSPLEHRLHSNLEPSKFSAEGFLGTDERPIDEIIAEDCRTLEQYGVTIEQVVGALRGAYKQCQRMVGNQIEVAAGLRGCFFEAMGRIPSPFRGDGVFEKGEAALTEVGGRRRVVKVTALGIALIEKHSFFQGRGSFYRIEPQEVIELFGLKPQSTAE
jgi:hypothetical protein